MAIPQLPIELIKIVLFIIIGVVISVKVWQFTVKIVNKYKKKDNDDFDFEEKLYG